MRLELTTHHGVQLLWKILGHPRVVAVHLVPPCGTSSRARDIRRHSGPDPKPLRSKVRPDGLPSLAGIFLQRVLMRCTNFQPRFFNGARCTVCSVPWKTLRVLICGILLSYIGWPATARNACSQFSPLHVQCAQEEAHQADL